MLAISHSDIAIIYPVFRISLTCKRSGRRSREGCGHCTRLCSEKTPSWAQLEVQTDVNGLGACAGRDPLHLFLWPFCDCARYSSAWLCDLKAVFALGIIRFLKLGG